MFRKTGSIEVIEGAVARYVAPEMLNSDQGCQFTSKEWADACTLHPEMKVSMDGHGRAKDNIWIERFWETIKYEYIYIQPEENGANIFFKIKRFIYDYNSGQDVTAETLTTCVTGGLQPKYYKDCLEIRWELATLTP